MLIIIVGAGNVGFNIAKKLSSENMDVVVVDSDATALARVEESLDVGVVQGNGASPSVLTQAGIERAEMLLAVTSSDEVNILASLMGTMKMPLGSTRIARIRNDSFLAEKELFSSNRIALDLSINPERVAAERIMRLLSVPSATDVMEFAGGKVQIINIPVKENSILTETIVKDLRTTYPENKVLFAAIVRDGRVLIPQGDDHFKAHDQVFTVGDPNQVGHVLHLAGYKHHHVKSVVIAGGNPIAHHLARALEKKGISTKIILPCEKQCQELAESFGGKVVVLHGEGTDLDLLEQEDVGGADAFVAACSYDEDNVLSALLAKRLGVPHTIVVTNKSSYLPIIQAVGVDAAISPHQVAVSSILHFIRRGKVLQVSALGDEAEAIEFEAVSTSPLVNKPLAQAHFPKGAIVAAIVRHDNCQKNGRTNGAGVIRLPLFSHGLDSHTHNTCPGNIIIPDGNDMVLPKDRVVVFALREAIPAVEKALAKRFHH